MRLNQPVLIIGAGPRNFHPEAVRSNCGRCRSILMLPVDPEVLLRSSAFELLIEFNIALAPTSPGLL